MRRESSSETAQRRAQTWQRPEPPRWPTADLSYEDTIRLREQMIEQELAEVTLGEALHLQAHPRPMERALFAFFALFAACGRICIG